MDLTETDVIKRVLAERGMDAERVLAGLLRTLVAWHAAGGMGGRADGASILDELMGRIMIAARDNAQQHQELAGEGKENDPDIDDELFMDGVISGDLAMVQSVLAEVLAGCRDVAERAAGRDPDREDDDEDGPTHMRLVRD
jgi:hypothetical protein